MSKCLGVSITPSHGKAYAKLVRRTNRLYIFIKTFLSLLLVLGYLSRDEIERVKSAYSTYTRQFLHGVNHEGLKETITLYKKLYIIAIKIVMQEQFLPLPFRKSDKAGIPTLLKPLKFLLLSNEPRLQRIGLTICGVHRLAKLPVSLNLTNITRKQEIHPEQEQSTKEFEQFVNKYLPQRLISDPENDFTFGVREGPNGPSVLTAHYDAHALKERPALYKAWWELADLICHPLRSSFRHCLKYPLKTIQPSELIVGRLSFLSEYGGKTRIIAIVDFWSQQLLKPFHTSIMSYLKEWETDSTHDQEAGFARVLKKSRGREVFSFDLEAATDRFPLYLQLIVAKRLWGTKAGDLWKTIMVDRDFYLDKKREKGHVRWKVGQPLGAYSSWVIFTLTHHLVVQFCYYKTLDEKGKRSYKLKQFNLYQLLGDDIILWCKSVASEYQLFLQIHGVNINLLKSLISSSTRSAGEFAKRLFYNGIEVSPVTLHLLLSASSSLYLIPALLSEISRKWKIPSSLIELYASECLVQNRKGQDVLRTLLSFNNLTQGIPCPPYCQFGSLPTLLRELWLYLQNNQIILLLGGRKKLNRLTNPFTSTTAFDAGFALGLLPLFKERGIEVSISLLSGLIRDDADDPHPIILVYTALDELLQRGTGWKGTDEVDPDLVYNKTEEEQNIDFLNKEILLMKHTMSTDLKPFFSKASDRKGAVKVGGQLALGFLAKLKSKAKLELSKSQ